MNKTERRAVEQDVLIDVLCDNCGQSCQVEGRNYEYATLVADWGYGSRWGGTRHYAQFCQDCWQRILDRFKVTTQEIVFI